jgi:hypothetical protein
MSADSMVRVYRGLIRLYPRRFRDEYGDDLVDLFRQQCRDEAPTRVYARTVVDLLVTVPTRHLEVSMPRRAPTTITLLYAAVALGGVATAVLAGSNLALVAIGLLVGLAATGLAITSGRRNTSTAAIDATGAWWKLAGAGIALIGGCIAGAYLGIDAWYLGMIAVLTGIGLVVGGVALGLAQAFRRRSSLAG